MLATGAGNAPAQTLRGTVSDTEGHPLSGAAVMLVGERSGVMLDSARADARGAFVLSAPDPGSYIVHVHLDGWADVPTDAVEIAAGQTRQVDFRVPLIGMSVIAEIGDRIAADPDLQRDLPQLCGEPMRPWEAGLVVGEVRDRATRARVAGARVWAESSSADTVRATITNGRGTFVLCNIPRGSGVRLRAATVDGRADSVDVEVRPGMVSWCDLLVRKQP